MEIGRKIRVEVKKWKFYQYMSYDDPERDNVMIFLPKNLKILCQTLKIRTYEESKLSLQIESGDG